MVINPTNDLLLDEDWGGYSREKFPSIVHENKDENRTIQGDKMIDYMVWAFAGLMALIAIYFARRARVNNDVSQASGNDANAAALEKSISQQLTMAQLEVKLEQAQAEAALLQTQVQESQLKHTQIQAQLGQLSVDNAS